jgi:hypothetical protein
MGLAAAPAQFKSFRVPRPEMELRGKLFRFDHFHAKSCDTSHKGG